MPSKSKAQHRFMEACAHNPSSMKSKCPSVKVAKEFVDADSALAHHRKRHKIK